jgi:outer membrane receptor protein involved in Fe transport
MLRASLAALVAVGAVAAPARAQDSTVADTTVRLTPVTVTATRSVKNVFRTPTPVTVVDQRKITESQANSISDLFRGVPGLDVTGVGAGQVRPIIRGQRGQRILLLSDGLRLNNSRRQQDFGEIPSLIDVASVERIEIVRGPSSVLYGTDAIGGVVNVITKRPETEGLHGTAGVRYSTLDDNRSGFGSGFNAAFGSLSGRFGALSIQARGSRRNTDSYVAPAGSWGRVTDAGQFVGILLDSDTRVNDSGIRDYSFDGRIGYEFAPGKEAFVRYEQFGADTSGFGYVDPAIFGPDEPLVRITYPQQRFQKVSMGYTGTLSLPFADRLDVKAYYQDNERDFDFDIFIPFGGGAGLSIDQRNYTDIETMGGRLEAKKFVGAVTELTYGVDFFRDVTVNTDTSVNSYVGIPIPPTTEDVPRIPNASYRSIGAFAQADVELTPWVSIVAGTRYQEVRAATRETPGITGPLNTTTDRTLVASANALLSLSDNVTAVASVGRAFRSPNLIERFFEGPTAEGFGYLSPNPDIKAETSLNVDLGLRYRDRQFYVEAFVFQNTVYNGIRSEPTGDTILTFPEFQYVNIERLRVRGFEFAGDVSLPMGLSLSSAFTHISSKNVTQDQFNPTGDGFSTQLTSAARYELPSRRAFVEYEVRHNFTRDDAEIAAGNPLGDIIPAFTVHTLRAGVVALRLGGQTGRLLVAVNNLTNTLYAEFTNAAFFRPEPRRNLVVSYVHAF